MDLLAKKGFLRGLLAALLAAFLVMGMIPMSASAHDTAASEANAATEETNDTSDMVDSSDVTNTTDSSDQSSTDSTPNALPQDNEAPEIDSQDALSVDVTSSEIAPLAGPAPPTTTIRASDLKVSDTSKQYGSTDPRPVLKGLPGNLVEGVDCTVTFTRTAGETVNETHGYESRVSHFTFTNSKYTLSGSVGSIGKGKLCISKRAITITAASASKVYDSTPLTDSSYTISGSGLAPGDTAHVTITGSQTDAGSSPNTVGNVIIKNSSNYTVTSCYTITKVNGSLTVTKAPLLITADDKTVVFGDVPPTYTVSYSGFVGSETEAVLITQPTATCSYAQFDASGSYPIDVAGADAANYTITYQPGTLTVSTNDLEIVVTAASASKMYDGSPLMDSACTYSGLPEGYTLTAFAEGSATNVSDSIPSNNNVIAESIIILDSLSQDVTANFTNIQTVAGNLEIFPCDISIIANDAEKQQGTADPAFSAVVLGIPGETAQTVTFGVQNEDTLTMASSEISLFAATADAPVYSLTRVAGETVGTYAIEVIPGDNPNYIVNTTPGLLTILANGSTTTSADPTDPSSPLSGLSTTGDPLSETLPFILGGILLASAIIALIGRRAYVMRRIDKN